MNIKKSHLLILTVVLISVFVYYRYATRVLQTEETSESAVSKNELVTDTGLRELTATTTHETPAGEDKVSFVISVDENHVIIEAKTLIEAENKVSKKYQEAFALEFPALIQGKKMSELTKIDRVGKSSLTTEAFNSVIDTLKAQL